MPLIRCFLSMHTGSKKGTKKPLASSMARGRANTRVTTSDSPLPHSNSLNRYQIIPLSITGEHRLRSTGPNGRSSGSSGDEISVCASPFPRTNRELSEWRFAATYFVSVYAFLFCIISLFFILSSHPSKFGTTFSFPSSYLTIVKK